MGLNISTPSGGTVELTVSGDVLRDGSNNSVIGGHPDNSIEGGGSNLIVGGGTTSNENQIVGTEALRTIVGGYDNTIEAGIANGILSSQHSEIRATATHSTIIGGSYGEIQAGADYSTIVGGTANINSGDYATVLGGASNEVTATQATIIGGAANTASGARSTVIGGTSGLAAGNDTIVAAGGKAYGTQSFAIGASAAVGNVGTPAHGDYSAALGGLSCKVGASANSRFSVVAGGRENSIGSEYAAIVGQRDVVLTGVGNQGMQGWGNGKFAAVGDAQAMRTVMRATTVDASPVLLSVDGGGTNRPTMPNDTAWVVTGTVVARRTDANNESAGYSFSFVADRNSGTGALVGTATVTVVGEDSAAWDLAIGVAANGAINLQVTGEAAKTIYWVALVDIVQVTG